MKIVGIVSKFLVFFLHVTLLSAPLHVDNATAFMWQDVPENKGTLYTWDEAKEYCQELDLGDFEDWWLPSEAELASIVDIKRPQGRRIQNGFIYYKAKPYWSASTYSWNAPDAWVISFDSGISYSQKKEMSLHVRCVRCSDFKACLEKFYSLEM